MEQEGEYLDFRYQRRSAALLTIMSSLAQEESRSISENCTWGQRKRFADGKVTVPFSHFLGYDKGPDGNLRLNKKQAEVVKRIYAMFLRGMTPHSIARKLTEEKIKTPAGRDKWNCTSVQSILTNEKYKGDALLQKTFCTDFLTKKMKIPEMQLCRCFKEEYRNISDLTACVPAEQICQ